MANIVIDANVWVMADRRLSDEVPPDERDCIQTCRKWLQDFAHGGDTLVVDWEYKILSEYRDNIQRDGFAEP